MLVGVGREGVDVVRSLLSTLCVKDGSVSGMLRYAMCLCLCLFICLMFTQFNY